MNLIANDIVMVQPMSSLTGYVAYVEYTTGVAKGGMDAGTVLNSPFGLGAVQSHYTSAKVVEPVTSFSSGTTKLAWTPVVEGSLKFLDASGDTLTATDVSVAADGTVTATIASGTVAKIAYEYDNESIPQNTIPTLKAEVRTIPLLAKARRIAVYYSNLAAFQAKNDYGFDLGEQLAEKSVGQLSFEIDTEVCDLLINNATDLSGTDDSGNDKLLRWNKALPNGVSKSEHYEGFAEIVELGKSVIYNATKRFVPNYMLIASDVLPVLSMTKAFVPAPASQINGPYLAGTFNTLKVFVSPALASGQFVIGVNGSDMMSSAAVYAPYMAIVPTQLLQYADGGTSQGFSTMYDLKMLNSNLVVKGAIYSDSTKAQSTVNTIAIS